MSSTESPETTSHEHFVAFAARRHLDEMLARPSADPLVRHTPGRQWP